jgi:hypothetical protein
MATEDVQNVKKQVKRLQKDTLTALFDSISDGPVSYKVD